MITADILEVPEGDKSAALEAMGRAVAPLVAKAWEADRKFFGDRPFNLNAQAMAQLWLSGDLKIFVAYDERQEPVGYLCDYPIFGQVAGINAFALGVQMSNPDAVVVLDWSTVGGAREAVARLTAQGIRLVSFTDTVRRGGDYVGVGLSLVQGGSQTGLALPVWQWGAYYEALVRRVQDHSLQAEYAESSKALNYYWGMSAGVVELKLSEALPDSGNWRTSCAPESVPEPATRSGDPCATSPGTCAPPMGKSSASNVSLIWTGSTRTCPGKSRPTGS